MVLSVRRNSPRPPSSPLALTPLSLSHSHPPTLSLWVLLGQRERDVGAVTDLGDANERPCNHHRRPPSPQQVIVIAFKSKPTKPFKVFPLRMEAGCLRAKSERTMPTQS